MKQPKQTVNKVFSPHHQRVLSVAVSIILQFSLYALVLFRFSRYFVYFYWTCFAISLLVALFISTRKTKLAYKVAWIVPILLLPVIGGMTYLMFGGARRPHYHREETRKTFQRELPATLSTTDLMRYGPDALQQAWYLGNTALCPAYTNTETAYFPSGKEFLQDYLAELEKAQDYIFLEYFIISEGSMWDEILEVLTRKAAQGVDVRVIYDGVGSAATLPVKYPDILHARGILCRVFQPLVPVLSIHQNNRDHRKITVIDGVTGYVSGLNLADEYVDRKERFGYWKDAALRVEGDAAWNFTVMFLNFWNAFRPSETDYDAFRPMPLVTPVSDGIVQPYADSPLDEEPMAETVYLNILAQAQRYVYIYTPYLAVGEEMLDALKNAAKRGVDIRLVLPGIPDKKLVFRLSRSYYLPLLRAGVRIYEYTPGFLHAKCWVSDDVTAVVGSINMDYRSLFLHFECGVLLQKNSQVAVLRDDVRATLPQCREIQVTECRTSLPGTVLDSVLRLLSPLM